MPEPHLPATFELGLVMAGAISGGAYAAGVVDFLIQALDAWEALKAQGADVPRHQVVIPVMSGASAGAMAAAIATVSFASETRPVADIAAPPAPELNRLYDAWVRQIDIHQLLGVRDLDGADKVTSLLEFDDFSGDCRLARCGCRRGRHPAPISQIRSRSSSRSAIFAAFLTAFVCSAAVPTRSTGCPAMPTTWPSR